MTRSGPRGGSVAREGGGATGFSRNRGRNAGCRRGTAWHQAALVKEHGKILHDLGHRAVHTARITAGEGARSKMGTFLSATSQLPPAHLVLLWCRRSHTNCRTADSCTVCGREPHRNGWSAGESRRCVHFRGQERGWGVVRRAVFEGAIGSRGVRRGARSPTVGIKGHKKMKVGKAARAQLPARPSLSRPRFNWPNWKLGPFDSLFLSPIPAQPPSPLRIPPLSCTALSSLGAEQGANFGVPSGSSSVYSRENPAAWRSDRGTWPLSLREEIAIAHFLFQPHCPTWREECPPTWIES